jgi:hypothetical protein
LAPAPNTESHLGGQTARQPQSHHRGRAGAHGLPIRKEQHITRRTQLPRPAAIVAMIATGIALALVTATPAIASEKGVDRAIKVTIDGLGNRGLRMRTCPRNSCGRVGNTIHNGNQVVIIQECMSGTPVYGDRKWDLVNEAPLWKTPRLCWISDWWVHGDGYQADRGVPQGC